ncbi:MAG: hypothetical protein A2284_00795 [Deltaproteobacteria bacterium RIFOXYA12_FULL_61_11]|nr:MAG: hypothetical protein A2284_00795 [Deltaproteobacteria bacterium RIFOXYA12_FULL_61_11]
MKVSVIIPAKEEAKTIADVIEGCRGHADELLVIDGHSRDGTAEVARRCGAEVHLDAGKGKGAALRQGIALATGEVLVFIDAEGSHDPDDIPRLVMPIVEGRAEHVQGSRIMGGSDELHGDVSKFLRNIGSDIITCGINLRFGAALTDSQNGFRAILREVALTLDLREDLTTIEQELIIKTLRAGYRLLEVPTHEYRRLYGHSKISLRRHSWRYVYSWLRYLL